jgi:hypothetical protein
MKYSIIFLVDEESDEFSGFFDLICTGFSSVKDEDVRGPGRCERHSRTLSRKA